MRPAAAMAGVRMYGLPPHRRGVGTAHVGLRRVDSDEVSSVAGTKKRRRDLAMKVAARSRDAGNGHERVRASGRLRHGKVRAHQKIEALPGLEASGGRDRAASSETARP